MEYHSELLQNPEEVRKLPRSVRHEFLLMLEQWVDSMLFAELMSREEAWDCYFGLLHECDEMAFWEDRSRILAKIDTEWYDPFKSKNPDVVMLACLRARGADAPPGS